MLEWMEEMLSGLADGLISLLPLSPFTEMIATLEQFPYLGMLNWFIPIAPMVGIAGGWLLAIGLYYAYSVIARWLKLIS